MTAITLKEMLAFFAGEAGDDVPVSKDFVGAIVMCPDEGRGDARKFLVVADQVLGAKGAFIGALAMVSTGNTDANRNALLRRRLDPMLTNS